MRKIVLLIFVALIIVGCDTRTEEQRYNDYLRKQKELKKRIEHQNRWNGYSVIVVDGCEYIVKTIDNHKGSRNATQSGYLAHKGNCRFCKERRQKELEKLIIKLKKNN